MENTFIIPGRILYYPAENTLLFPEILYYSPEILHYSLEEYFTIPWKILHYSAENTLLVRGRILWSSRKILYYSAENTLAFPEKYFGVRLRGSGFAQMPYKTLHFLANRYWMGPWIGPPGKILYYSRKYTLLFPEIYFIIPQKYTLLFRGKILYYSVENTLLFP